MQPTPGPVDAKALTAASSLAARRPERLLPCPRAASVRGANLERHVREKHPEASSAAVSPGGTVHVGSDRRIRRFLAVLAVGWLAVLAALAFADAGGIIEPENNQPGDFSGSTVSGGLGDVVSSPFGATFVLGVVAAAIIAFLVHRDAFPARLSVTPEEIRLHHRVGTGEISVPMPAQVETGSLFRRFQVGAQGNQGGVTLEENVGLYLRLGNGRRTITVGCRQGTAFRKHWAGWKQAKRRQSWDVTLPAPSFVALQYELAEAGILTPHG